MTYHSKPLDKHDRMADMILTGLTDRDEWPNVEPLLASALRRHEEGYMMQSASGLRFEMDDFLSWFSPKPDTFRADWRAVCLDS